MTEYYDSLETRDPAEREFFERMGIIPRFREITEPDPPRTPPLARQK